MSNSRRVMQRLRSQQSRNRRVALLHEKTEISNNEQVEATSAEIDVKILQEQEMECIINLK